MPRTIVSKITEDPNYLKKQTGKMNSKSRSRKAKYRKISFKITESQKEILEIICKKQKTTPVRYLKSVIKKQTSKFKPSAIPNYSTENQLQLFELEPTPKVLKR